MPPKGQGIEADLDAHALRKKKLRLDDRKFRESQTDDFTGLDIEECVLSSQKMNRFGVEKRTTMDLLEVK